MLFDIVCLIIYNQKYKTDIWKLNMRLIFYKPGGVLASTGAWRIYQASRGTHGASLIKYALNVNAEDNFALAA